MKVVGIHRIYSIDGDGVQCELNWDQYHQMLKIGEVDWTIPEHCDAITLERDCYGTLWLKQDDQWIRLAFNQPKALFAVLSNLVAGQ